MDFPSKDVALHKAILTELGYELEPNSLILDFGCGAGELVQEYRDAGFQAFGVDVVLERQHPLLRRIPEDPYRIPFEDSTFDFVVSNSVLEHVRDLSSALGEIKRVLKPNGVSLHLFPPKARPIEPHVFVPLAGIVRNRLWLLLWALIGVRNSFQRGLSFQEVAKRNYVYLRDRTFYRSKSAFRAQSGDKFQNVVFADRQMIRHSYGQARRLSSLVGIFPVVAGLYGSLHNRCVVLSNRPFLQRP